MSFLKKIPGVKHIPGIGGKGGGIPNPIKEVKDTAGDVAKLVEKEVKKAVPDEVKKAIKDIGGELESLIVDALTKLAGEAVKPGFTLAAQMCKVTRDVMHPLLSKASEQDKKDLHKAPFVLPFTLGVVSIGFYWYGTLDGSRLEAIEATCRQYASKGIQAKRSSILRAVKDFGPDHVDIGIGVQIALGIQLGVTPSIWSLPTRFFIELADHLMKKAGVPA